MREISTQDAKSMVRELLDLESGLTDWEVNFLDDIAGRESFTPKQSQTIERIWEERIGNKR